MFKTQQTVSYLLTFILCFITPFSLANNDTLNISSNTEVQQQTVAPIILAASKFSDLAKQLGLTDDSSAELLTPEEAFKYDLISVNDNKLIASWQVVPGHYLYQKEIKFSVISADNPDIVQNITLGDINYAPTKTKEDPSFGNVEVYESDFEITLPIDGASGIVTLETGYQGCSDLTGICYPPQKVSHSLFFGDPKPDTPSSAKKLINSTLEEAIAQPAGSLIKRIKPADTTENKADEQTTAPPSNTASEPAPLTTSIDTQSVMNELANAKRAVAAPTTATPVQALTPSPTNNNNTNNSFDQVELPESEHDSIFNQLKSVSGTAALGIIFLIGIGLAFTPCVYPMVPILSSIIVGQGQGTTTRKAFTLSLAYVLPMAFIYGVAGYFIGLSGENLQVIFQKPWVLISFAILFILFALSMFGFYELQMPRGIQNRLTSLSNNQESGTLMGAAIMGALSALIVGPCVTGPLMAVFTYIAYVGDPTWGALDMFALGLGIGLPLLILGTSAGKLLPRAGAWMEATKAIFGVVMLGMAIWMLERVLAAPIIMAMSAVLLIVSGVYMGALSTPPSTATKWALLWKGLGLSAVIYGAYILLGTAMGGQYVLQPLSGLNSPALSSNSATSNKNVAHANFKRFKGLDGLKREVAIAKANGKPVMVDFYADWCTYCKTLEKEVFPHPKVSKALNDYVLLQTDITPMDEADKALLKHYGLLAPPILLFFSPNGEEQAKFRLFGNVGIDQLAKHASLFASIR